MTRRFPRGTALAVVAVTLVLLAGGCSNPFLPAQPEPPSTGSTVDPVPIDFSSPEGLLATLTYAIQAKNQVNGQAAYLQTLADQNTQGVEVAFVMDQAVVDERAQGGKSFPAEWLRVPHEVEFYVYLSGYHAGDYAFVLEPDGTDVEDTPDHRTLFRKYTLTATDDEGATDLATGRVEFEVTRVTISPDRWAITKWTDHIIDTTTGPNPADPGKWSFSRLRNDSYNRPQ